jgi:hypothetical protein
VNGPGNKWTPRCFSRMVQDELVKNAKAVYIVFIGNPSKVLILPEGTCQRVKTSHDITLLGRKEGLRELPPKPEDELIQGMPTTNAV